MMQRHMARQRTKFPRRRAPASWAAALGLFGALTGCRQDMHDQPKFLPQRGTTFYADGRSARPQVVGTVARSQGEMLDYFHTGLVDRKEADGLPIPLTTGTLARGQERYNIYCAPCHSRVGNGAGMIVQRGYYPAANFHSSRLRDAPLGHFFRVMTQGYGAMPNYAAELTPEDRWAVAAYIRALQLSQNARPTDLPPGKKADTLEHIAVNHGFSPEFLDVWFPHRHATGAPSPAPAAPVAVTASAPPAVLSKVTTEATTKEVPAVAGGKTPAIAPAITSKAAETPATTAAVASAHPPAVHDRAVGQSVYMHNCAGCHQISRAGMPPNIPSLIGIVPKDGEERVRAVLADGIPTGKPPMPSFSRLSQEDIDNLISFLQPGN
jgi:mono/diheme cytochrome c family protein